MRFLLLAVLVLAVVGVGEALFVDVPTAEAAQCDHVIVWYCDEICPRPVLDPKCR